MASTVPYDLIILDLMLPGMSGTEVLRRLQQKGCSAAMLVLTASDSIGEKVKQFEAGADDYLTKPFAYAELMVRIKALLCAGRRPATATSCGSGTWSWIG